MRFAIATGVLAQTLPVSSEANDLVAILAGNLEQLEQTSIHSLLQRGNDAKPKLLNGILRKNGRKHAASWLNQRVHHNEALKNAPQGESAVVECDPKKSADVGVLSCGPGKFCKESESSSLGGVCNDSVFRATRLLQGSNATSTASNETIAEETIVEYYYQTFCNESSPTFQTNYTCGCENFDPATSVGTIECLVYEDVCLAPYCNDTCLDGTLTYTAEGPKDYGYTICVSINDGEETGCYGYYATEDSYGCTATWNGDDCTCTILGSNYDACPATIDCPGDGPSGICFTDFLVQFTTITSCIPALCGLCLGSEVNADAILELPGYGSVNCSTLESLAIDGQLNETECTLVQAISQDDCCVGDAVAGSVAPAVSESDSIPSMPPTAIPVQSDSTTTMPPSPAPGDSTVGGVPTVSPTGASEAMGLLNGKSVVSFVGLSMAMAVYLGL